MEIVKNKKRVNAIELFPSVNDFITEIKKIGTSYNFESNDILHKINRIYEKLINDEGRVKYLRLTRWLHKEFGFKFKTFVQLNFWVERGWSPEIGKEKISEIVKKSCVKGVKTKKDKKSNIVFDGEERMVKYSTVEFKTTTHPKCNLCKNELILKKINIKNLDDLYYYRIIKCSNDSCRTKRFGKNKLYKSFLPEDVSQKKLNELYDKIKIRNRYCVDSWLKKGYTEEEAKSLISEIQKKNASMVKERFRGTKENYRKLGYSEEEIERICEAPAMVSFWVRKGYTEEEAKKKISELQSYASKFVDYKNKPTPNKLDYWVKKGYTEEEAKKMRYNRQHTFSLKKCIEKYGEEEGKKRFTDRQIKWSKSLSSNGKLKIGYSKISQDLFYELLEKYDINERDKIFFGTHNKEFKLKKPNGGLWFYDFTDTINKKIIEYNGDQYHGNPSKFKSTDNPHPFRKDLTAEEMWKKDEDKINEAKKNGYEILIIWDSEYRWGDKDKIINKCLEFLKKNDYICK